MHGEEVAIKIVRRDYLEEGDRETDGEGGRRRLEGAVRQHEREWHRLSRLKFASIVQFFGVAREPRSGSLMIITEFMRGKSLHFSLVKMRHVKVRFDERSFVRMARQITGGLNYVHSNHLTHGDIKPHNILLTNPVDVRDGQGWFLDDNWRAKLADFGLSMRLTRNDDDTSLTGDFGQGAVGTFSYMAPEAYRDYTNLSAEAAKAVDVYALGIVLQEMLTGRQPWVAENVRDRFVLYNLVYNEKKRPMWGDLDGIDEEYVRIINQCMKHSPDERPTAAELNAFFNKREKDMTKSSKVVSFDRRISSKISPVTGPPSQTSGPATSAEKPTKSGEPIRGEEPFQVSFVEPDVQIVETARLEVDKHAERSRYKYPASRRGQNIVDTDLTENSSVMSAPSTNFQASNSSSSADDPSERPDHEHNDLVEDSVAHQVMKRIVTERVPVPQLANIQLPGLGVEEPDDLFKTSSRSRSVSALQASNSSSTADDPSERLDPEHNDLVEDSVAHQVMKRIVTERVAVPQLTDIQLPELPVKEPDDVLKGSSPPATAPKPKTPYSIFIPSDGLKTVDSNQGASIDGEYVEKRPSPFQTPGLVLPPTNELAGVGASGGATGLSAFLSPDSAHRNQVFDSFVNAAHGTGQGESHFNVSNHPDDPPADAFSIPSMKDAHEKRNQLTLDSFIREANGESASPQNLRNNSAASLAEQIGRIDLGEAKNSTPTAQRNIAPSLALPTGTDPASEVDDRSQHENKVGRSPASSSIKERIAHFGHHALLDSRGDNDLNPDALDSLADRVDDSFVEVKAQVESSPKRNDPSTESLDLSSEERTDFPSSSLSVKNGARNCFSADPPRKYSPPRDDGWVDDEVRWYEDNLELGTVSSSSVGTVPKKQAISPFTLPDSSSMSLPLQTRLTPPPESRPPQADSKPLHHRPHLLYPKPTVPQTPQTPTRQATTPPTSALQNYTARLRNAKLSADGLAVIRSAFLAIPNEVEFALRGINQDQLLPLAQAVGRGMNILAGNGRADGVQLAMMCGRAVMAAGRALQMGPPVARILIESGGMQAFRLVLERNYFADGVMSCALAFAVQLVASGRKVRQQLVMECNLLYYLQKILMQSLHDYFIRNRPVLAVKRTAQCAVTAIAMIAKDAQNEFTCNNVANISNLLGQFGRVNHADRQDVVIMINCLRVAERYGRENLDFGFCPGERKLSAP